MAHRNSQASVPFALSSLGYGFLWNNPAVGRAVLGKNVMSFEAYSTKELDYWVTAGETPREIVQAYAKATGYVPMMPEYGLGFWQCKLRYWNQEQVLEVAREYRRRELPIDLIVVDFFHWRNQGDWSFDPEFFPDPGTFDREKTQTLERWLTGINRCDGQGAQRPQDRTHGLDLADCARIFRELPRNARKGTPHSYGSWN
jgi:alpha-D-xyloside xylohydrolase